MSYQGMGYKLENITTRQAISCSDERWRLLIETARGNGWDEEGTSYDFEFELDETYDPMIDYLYNLWMMFHLTREMFDWDGNYIDKKGQVVSESDAYNLMQALRETAAADDGALLDFFNSGSFRIRGV